MPLLSGQLLPRTATSSVDTSYQNGTINLAVEAVEEVFALEDREPVTVALDVFSTVSGTTINDYESTRTESNEEFHIVQNEMLITMR